MKKFIIFAFSLFASAVSIGAHATGYPASACNTLSKCTEVIPTSVIGAGGAPMPAGTAGDPLYVLGASGGVTNVQGLTADGASNTANPLMTGGTSDGTASGLSDVIKVDPLGNQYNIDTPVDNGAVAGVGTLSAAGTLFDTGQNASAAGYGGAVVTFSAVGSAAVMTAYGTDDITSATPTVLAVLVQGQVNSGGALADTNTVNPPSANLGYHFATRGYPRIIVKLATVTGAYTATAHLSKDGPAPRSFFLSAGNTISVSPVGATSTVTNSTITTGNTYQSALASNTSRKGCLITNKSTNTELIFIGAPGSAATATSLILAAGTASTDGGSFSCGLSQGVVITDQISITSATSTSAYNVISQ